MIKIKDDMKINKQYHTYEVSELYCIHKDPILTCVAPAMKYNKIFYLCHDKEQFMSY